jgi:zinc D-Ala-D-Ala carboxypeptidase
MFKYFDIGEFVCQETGDNEISEDFVHELDKLRGACGFPFRITSGYRSKEHSIEARKQTPGTHTQGIAADIAVQGGAQRMILVQKALELGITGVGVAKTYIHVDTRKTTPVLWCY